MPETIMQGRKAGPGGRRPRTFNEDRVCAAPGCETTLSRYNRNEHCYAHSPIRYPRTRGRVIEGS